MDHDPVRILVVLDTAPDHETITWTPIMERHLARDCCRDWSHAESYDGHPVGWDPCDTAGCRVPEHVQRVKRALIVDVTQ